MFMYSRPIITLAYFLRFSVLCALFYRVNREIEKVMLMHQSINQLFYSAPKS